MKENEMEKQEKWRPKVNFGMDINEDIETFMKFWRWERSAKIKGLKYLESIDDENVCRKESENYIKDFYQKNSEQINNEIIKAEQKWHEVENNYYEKVDELFHGYLWPKEEYLAVGSIMNIYMRWIKQKKFAFPINPDFNKDYLDKSQPLTIAHEMLHFIAYDYLEKKFGLVPSQWKDENNSFWQFTENLNVLIENEPYWPQVLGINAGGLRQPYPECRAQYEKMKPLWDKSKSIDDLVRNILIN